MTMADGSGPFRGTKSDFARMAAAEDAEMLKELAGIGMRLVRLLETNAEAKMAVDPACDLGPVDQAFAKLSRSVRQTLALKAKLSELAAKRNSAVAGDERKREADASRRRWRKVKLGRAVAETVKAEYSRSDTENLLTDLQERLDDPDIDVDLATRSIGEMVASVCDDLGIEINREIWRAKGWYLTENWRVRDPVEPVPQAPARSIEEITAEALAMMDEMNSWPAATRRPAHLGQPMIGEENRQGSTPPPVPLARFRDQKSRISRSLVSGTKIMPTTKVMPAMMIGYQSPL